MYFNSCKIHWKPGKDLTKKKVAVKNNNRGRGKRGGGYFFFVLTHFFDVIAHIVFCQVVVAALLVRSL